MKSTFDVWFAEDIVKRAIQGKLHPNPIGQRPPVTSGYNKSIGIINALILGYGIGMIIVRDIRDDVEMQKVYPGVEYLVIDGGHRVRAMVDYYQDKFRINGNFYKQSSVDFSSIEVPVEIKICTSPESIEIFRNVNETTGVNPIEMIMCDDQSEICKEVRSRTSYYREYNNIPHDLFNSYYDNKKQKNISSYFSCAPNHRREWDKYIFVAIHKTIGKGNVDAGEAISEKLIDLEYKGNNKVNKTVLKTVDRFLDDVLNFQRTRGNNVKLSGDLFSAFQLVWFGFYGKNQQFKIDDMRKFHNRFMDVYSLLTAHKIVDTRYSQKTIDIEGETVNIKEFFRSNMKNFANGKYQKMCEDIFLQELEEDCGVIFREEKRSISTLEREAKLASQGYVCAIDGEPLTLEDSVWGHDTPWAQGGQLTDGAVIRKSHNRDMGCTTLDEYRLILNMRKKNKAA